MVAAITTGWTSAAYVPGLAVAGTATVSRSGRGPLRFVKVAGSVTSHEGGIVPPAGRSCREIEYGIEGGGTTLPTTVVEPLSPVGTDMEMLDGESPISAAKA
jgi:hypothetical protein